jgi:cytochrome c oxidase assembly protein subunit 15
MASNERVAGVRSATRRVPFSHLVAGTLLAVTLTILLGIATKATGSGLACNARWPVCDGGLLNLFPATLPSFFEWIHRVVAGLTGVVILGTAVAAWRQDVPPRVRQAATLGLVLLPLQVLLGRETVISFTLPILVAHFWTAFTIFASFAVATALTWRAALTARRLRVLAAAGAALVPLQVLLHPPVVTSFTPTVHTVQYAVTLSVFALAVAVAVGARDHLDGRVRTLAVVLPLVHPSLVLAGRHLFASGGLALGAYQLLAVALVGGLATVAVAAHRQVAG